MRAAERRRSVAKQVCLKLGAMPETFQSQGAELFLARSGGEGLPVVMVHGLGSSFYTWRFQLQHGEKSMEFLALDLPGFGASDEPAEQPSLEQHVLAIEDCLVQTGHEQAILCGHSYGGLVCLEFAFRCPEKVLGLLLTAPPLPDYPVNGEAMRNLLLYSYDNLDTLDDDFFAFYKAVCVRTPAGMLAWERFPRLSDAFLACPCEFVWGKRDRVVPEIILAQWRKCIPHAGWTMFSDAGHCLHEEQPQRFLKHLVEFASSL